MQRTIIQYSSSALPSVQMMTGAPEGGHVPRAATGAPTNRDRCPLYPGCQCGPTPQPGCPKYDRPAPSKRAPNPMFLIGLMGLVFLLALMASCNFAKAHTRNDITIKHAENGGALMHFADQIAAMEYLGQAVTIGGGYCASACTMYLKIAACVYPNTRFGFHAPRAANGLALDVDAYLRARRLMVSHYPAPLRDWFDKTVRDQTHGQHHLTGRQLIQMGAAKRCP